MTDKTTLTTVDAVVDALGGRDAVMALTGASYQNFYNWRRFKTFPAHEFDRMSRALRRRRKRAPPWLWNQSGSEKPAPADHNTNGKKRRRQ